MSEKLPYWLQTNYRCVFYDVQNEIVVDMTENDMDSAMKTQSRIKPEYRILGYSICRDSEDWLLYLWKLFPKKELV